MPVGSRAVAVNLRLLQLAALLGIALWLIGCQSAPKVIAPAVAPAEVIAAWPTRRVQLQTRSQFTAQGRIGIVTGSDGVQGHLRWTQDGARSTVSLDGPLGVGGVRIVDDAGMLTVTNSSGQVLDSEAARESLVQRMGFEPPLSSLRYWIQGVPDPVDPSSENLNAQGCLGSLAQSGWTITYNDYMQTPDGALPQKLTVTRDKVRVKLSIQAWRSP